MQTYKNPQRKWNVYEEMVKFRLQSELDYYFENIEKFGVKFESKKFELNELNDSLYQKMCECEILNSKYREIYTQGMTSMLDIDYARMNWDILLEEHIRPFMFPSHWSLKQVGEELDNGLEIQKIYDQIWASFNEWEEILEDIRYDFDELDKE